MSSGKKEKKKVAKVKRVGSDQPTALIGIWLPLSCTPFWLLLSFQPQVTTSTSLKIKMKVREAKRWRPSNRNQSSRGSQHRKAHLAVLSELHLTSRRPLLVIQLVIRSISKSINLYISFYSSQWLWAYIWKPGRRGQSGQCKENFEQDCRSIALRHADCSLGSKRLWAHLPRPDSGRRE